MNDNEKGNKRCGAVGICFILALCLIFSAVVAHRNGLFAADKKLPQNL